MTDQELLAEYPLPVSFPKLQGEHYMLIWWTYSESNNIIMARTPEQLIELWRILLNSRDGNRAHAAPRRVYKIDIVSPPKSFQRSYAKEARRGELIHFVHWLSSKLDLLDELPSGFSKCPKCAPPEKLASYQQHEKNAHSDCSNCRDGYVFDLEEQHQRLKAKYRMEQRRAARVGKPSRSSVAPLKKKGKALFMVTDAFGEGQDGTMVSQVTSGRDCFLEKIKFFCHAEELKMPEEILSLRKKTDLKLEKSYRLREKEIDAERAEEGRKLRLQAKELFT